VLGDVAKLVYAANSYSKPLVLYLGKLEMGSTKARRAGDRRDGVADSGFEQLDDGGRKPGVLSRRRWNRESTFFKLYWI